MSRAFFSCDKIIELRETLRSLAEITDFYRRNVLCRSDSLTRICLPASDAGAFGLACLLSGEPLAKDAENRRLWRQVLRSFEHMLDLNRRKTRPLVRPPLRTSESVDFPSVRDGRTRRVATKCAARPAPQCRVRPIGVRPLGRLRSSVSSKVLCTGRRRRWLFGHSHKGRAHVSRRSQVLWHRKRAFIYEPITASGSETVIDKNCLLIFTNDLGA